MKQSWEINFCRSSVLFICLLFTYFKNMKFHHGAAVEFYHGFALVFSRNLVLLPFNKKWALVISSDLKGKMAVLPLRIPVILSLHGNAEDSRFPKDFLSKFKYVNTSYNKKIRKMCESCCMKSFHPNLHDSALFNLS